MSVTGVIVITGFTSAICSSIIASLLYKVKWFCHRKKSSWQVLNLVFTALYQYNNKFYNHFPMLRELMACTLLTSLFFKYLIAPDCYTNPECIAGTFMLVILVTTTIHIIVYSKLFDEKLAV
ncbi:MAG: hypothetical protein M0R37_06290 [Bacteroidales bacterium]|nr:hypothetical protein [Bacteroidales bacterium]